MMAETLVSIGARAIKSARLGQSLRRSIHATASLRGYFNVQDENDFQERVIKSKQPVLVDFFATWCGPCKLLDPRLKAAIAEYEGKISLAKVDIDELQDLAIRFNVSSVPTVMAIKNGNVTDKFIGLADEDKIKAFINKAINDATTATSKK